MDKKFSTREYNNRTVYDCFNNLFPAGYSSPNLNIPPITIDDRTQPDKIALYNPDILPSAISFASENSVSNLITPYY